MLNKDCRFSMSRTTRLISQVWQGDGVIECTKVRHSTTTIHCQDEGEKESLVLRQLLLLLKLEGRLALPCIFTFLLLAQAIQLSVNQKRVRKFAEWAACKFTVPFLLFPILFPQMSCCIFALNRREVDVRWKAM